MVDDEIQGFGTKAVHGRRSDRRELPYHALTTPIVETATYTFESSADLVQYADSKLFGDTKGRTEYARYGNPTVRSAEKRLAVLEGGEDALLLSSGMAAITQTMLTILPAGSHLIITDDSYRKTRQFCQTFLARLGIEHTIVPMGDYEAMETAIRPTTRLIFSESPTNPYLRVIDLARVAQIAQRHRRIKTMIDATFATPINVQPLQYGLDLVVHSATKYLGGHNDLLAGVVIGEAGLINSLRQAQGMLGSVVAPSTAYQLERGLKTVQVRVERQNQSADKIAHFLADHPAIEQVWYPSLPSHPDYAVAGQQMRGFGGVVSFTVRPRHQETGLLAGQRVMDGVKIPLIAASLGGVETLIEQPATVSYHELSTEERLAVGIRDNLLRLAVGLEDSADLIADLDQALRL